MANKGHIIGYARVSSSGQSLDIQVDKLKEHGCDKIYQEKVTGMEQNRSQLIACLDYIREGDTLVITKLDRMARSSLHLGKIVERLNDKKVNFRVLDQSIDTTTPQGKLMFHMLSAFAEFENGIRRERQVEGIEKAKKSGIKFGRKFQLTPEVVKQVEIESGKGQPVKEILERFDIARVTYYKIKNGNHPYQIKKEKIC